MAQPAQSFGSYVCRSCRQSLRKGNQLRTFSNTAQRSKTIPVFAPSSSNELDGLLAEWRHKVFTPAVLEARHRDLIYKKSRHDLLINDPGVTVTLANDEEIKLEPMEEWDKPNKRKSLTKIANILSSSPDTELWSNLEPFLEGLQTANYRLPEHWLEKITRKANEQDKQGVIIRCAEKVKKTGVRLTDKAVTRELMLGCHERAAAAGFEGEIVQEQGRIANRIALMLETPEHGNRAKLDLNETDMRRHPLVLATLLEFAAEEAIHLHGKKDPSGKIASYAQKILTLNDQLEGGLVKATEETLPERSLENWVILYNAIELAMKTDANIGKTALLRISRIIQGRMKDTEGRVREDSKGKPRRALLMLDQARAIQKTIA